MIQNQQNEVIGRGNYHVSKQPFIFLHLRSITLNRIQRKGIKNSRCDASVAALLGYHADLARNLRTIQTWRRDVSKPPYRRPSSRFRDIYFVMVLLYDPSNRWDRPMSNYVYWFGSGPDFIWRKLFFLLMINWKWYEKWYGQSGWDVSVFKNPIREKTDSHPWGVDVNN